MPPPPPSPFRYTNPTTPRCQCLSGDSCNSSPRAAKPQITPKSHQPHGPAKTHQGKRCVGSCNEQIYSGMIEDLKEAFCAGMLNTVVKRGRRVKKHQRRTKNTDADDVPCIAVGACKSGQYSQCGDRQYDPDPMGDAVGHLFDETISIDTRLHEC